LSGRRGNCKIPNIIGHFIVDECQTIISNILNILTHHTFISVQPERPGWQEPETIDVTGKALAHCILGEFWG
jgi:hypothetical protein